MIESLKDQLLNVSGMSSGGSGNKSFANFEDDRSEVMSTSTVSKVEDAARMADVESSFEER